MIPTSWEDTTIRMILREHQLRKILPKSPVVAMISAYSGIPIDKLEVAGVQSVKEVMEILGGFITTEYEPEMRSEFEHKGKKYVMTEDLANLEFQEWINIQTILFNYKDDIVQALPRIIATLAKLPGEKFSDIDVDARAAEFLDLSYASARNIEVFFWHNANALKQSFQLSLMQDAQEKFILQQFNELNNIMSKRKVEPGTSWHIRWRIGFMQIYLRFLKRRLEKYYNTRHSEL